MPSHLAEPLRRVPRQGRGRNRVSALLDAAADVISEVGYEPATMSAIAARAGASIGSLYQFFPNKIAVAQALRTRQTECYGRLLAGMEDDAARLSTRAFLASLVDITRQFADTHPAFLPLLDAPRNTRSTPAARDDVRKRLAGLFRIRDSRLTPANAATVATVTLYLMKTMNQLYAESNARDGRRFVEEFKVVLNCYVCARLRDSPEPPAEAREIR